MYKYLFVSFGGGDVDIIYDIFCDLCKVDVGDKVICRIFKRF